MRVENTRAPNAVRLRHSAGFYGSDADLLAQVAPIVRDALDRGEPVALGLRPPTEEALTDVLGSLSGTIELEAPEGLSGQTLAARRARQLRALTSAAGPVTVVTEHWSRFDGADGVFWTELDAAVNVALSDLPVIQTCFFPQLPLHQAVLDGAQRNHPTLLVGGRLRPNAAYASAYDVLKETPAPAPILLGPPDMRRTFGAWELNEVRALVERELIAAGFIRSRAEDVVLAVNEITTNAVEHGIPDAEICLWASDGFVFEVHDRGRLADPLPGLVAPHAGDPRGRGVWIARQLCDSLHVWADGQGTHVRIRAAP